MKKKYYIQQKRIPKLKDTLNSDLENILRACEEHQETWSWAIRGLARYDTSLLEKVTP